MEFDEIVVKESPGLCRCCLSEGCYKDMGTEYTWMSENEVYADMLLECFDIGISQHNDGPNGPNRLICEVCITRLRDACNFKKQVLDSEKKFVDMIGRGEFRPKVLIYQSQMKAESNEEIEDTEVEYLEEDLGDFVDEDDQPLKSEDQEPSVSEVAAEPLPVPKRGRPRKNAEKPEKKRKVEERPKTSKAVVKDEKNVNARAPYEGCASERRRKNLKILFNHTSIIPFKWRGRYLCFYCPKNFTDYTEFKTHTISHGTCSTKDYSLRSIKGSHVEIKIDVSEVICKVCAEPFSNWTEIVDHLTMKHEMEYDRTVEVPLQAYRLSDMSCLFCTEQFTYFGNLISHVNVTHPQNNLICDDCGVSFNKKRDLAVHCRYHHRKGGYPCEQCAQTFDNFYTLRSHKNTAHFRKCSSCNLRFGTMTLLQKHISLEHPDTGNLTCEYCSKLCHTVQGLRQHKSKCRVKMICTSDDGGSSVAMYNVQPSKRQNIKQIRQNIQCVLNMSTAVPFKFFSKFSCFYCSKKFFEFEDLKQHTAIEHPVCDLESKYMRKCKGERINVKIDISSLACKVCCQPIEELHTLVDHLISEHKANYDKTAARCLDPYKIIKDSIPCPLCPDRTFRYFGILLRHINSDHSNNNKICDFCGRAFRNVVNLNVHISYAHVGMCTCDVCGMKCKNQWCLARHRAKTHNAKDFKCPKCPEQFQSQYHKQKHLIKMHDVGHKCVHCGKMFTRNSFMKDHVRRIHLKEKNVPCPLCAERFFDNYLLKMHMVKHEGERRFCCTVCGKAFLRRSNLHSHMEMHKKYGHVMGAIQDVIN